jgi:hypothetical protein
MRYQKAKYLLPLVATAGLLGVRGHAGVVKIDFNTDPSTLNLYDQDPNVLGNSQWRANYGFSGAKGDGYLSVTDALGSQRGVLIFNDLENGLVVKAFTFDMDVRIGGSTSSRPADGFSVNYCSADDPVVTRADGSGWSGTDSEPGTDHGGTGGGLPEEGTSTGIGVGFDEWQSGTIKGAQDVQGISLRVEGNLILQWPVPISPSNIYYATDPTPGNQGTKYTYANDSLNHLAPTNPNYIHSLQTGPLNPKAYPQDPNADQSPDPQATDPAVQATWSWASLVWEHFTTGVDVNGNLTVIYKGQNLTGTNGLPTAFAPRQGRIVFGGRTGGANDNRHIDNIVLKTTPADTLIVGPTTGYAQGFSAQIVDSGNSILNPSSLKVSLNGVDVTSQGTANKPAGSSTTTFTVALGLNQLLPAGSTNVVSVSCMDTRTPPVAVTGTRSFVVANYTTIDGSFATKTPASGSGFNLTMAQVDSTGPGRGLTHQDANGIIAAENQIAGGLYDYGTHKQATDTVNQGEAPGNKSTAAFINFDYQAGDPGGDHFNSTSPADNPVPNVAFPGIDLDVNNQANNFTMVATSFLHFKPGYYRLVVNSDDGFEVSTARGIGDQFGTVLGDYNGGRGSSDTSFDIAVLTEGDYPFRLAYWQGGGGANCEFFSSDVNTGARALVGGTQTGAIVAHANGSGAAYARSISPYPGWTGADSQQPVVLTLVDDATTVNQGSIKATLDGASVTPTIAKSGAVTTVTIAAPSAGWGFGVAHAGTFAYSETGSTNTRTLNFNFTGRLVTPYDLPANSFWVEAEDFNYNNGQVMSAVNTMPYLGGAYDNIGTGVYGVDYHDDNTVSGTSSSSRQEQDANGGSHVPTTGNLGNRWGAQRPGGVIMNEDYRIGWTGGGQWMNYTRTIPVGIYKVYAGLSYGGTSAGQMTGELDFVTSDPTAANQTISKIGTFNAPGSGAWGNNDLAVMQAPDGSDGILKIKKTANTLRFNPSSGDFDFFILAPQTGVAPKVIAATPANNDYKPRNTALNIQIQDLSTAVDPSSIQLTYDGASVTPTVSKSDDVTTVAYTPTPLPAIGNHTYVLTYKDNGSPAQTITFTATYGANPFGTPGQFLVEAEDFDYSGGQTAAAASTMPYTGLAFTQLIPTPGIDYTSDNGNDSDDYSRGYKSTAAPSQKNIDNNENGDFNRGLWTMKENYKCGWTDTNTWMNYTRTIPAGTYAVYVGLSHGDAAGTVNDCRGALGIVTAGAGTANQTVATSGYFRGPATGGWGNNRLLPLLDSNALDANNEPTGNPTTITVGSGPTTLRFNEDNGDFDYFVLIPATSSAKPTVSVGWDNSGTKVVVTFTGTLQSASSLAGPFTDVSGASSPYTPAAATGNLFYRSRN